MIAATFFTGIDWAVLLGYFVAILGLGLFFWRRNQSAEQFTAGGRTLSGWLCGLSIFATYLSSISYLALPGKAFVDNWNVFVYSLALPLAAAIAVRYFVPLYRHSGEVSAYSLLERRFGLWARIYASCFYLLYQIARIGVVMYLMALPMAVLFGWDIRTVILCTGVVVTIYSFVGGLVAVIWADAIQAIVLLAGALLALAILLWDMPGGFSEVIDVANAADKFSLSPVDSSDPSRAISFWAISEKTIWVIFAYGIFDNLRNFGIDQSYIQRYIASRSDREAVQSVWFGALLYVPVSALFLFIGSSLYAHYESHPEDLQEVRVIVAEQKLMQSGVPNDAPEYDLQLAETAVALQERDLGDRVFPHFIAAHLPEGARGLLIAAIFAAAMSTVSTSLNSSATLVLSDFYRRLIRPQSIDAEDVGVLRLSTIAWGVLGTLTALGLIRLTESALDVWWLLSGVLGAAIIGLFLLGLLVPAIRSPGAITASILGVLLIAWMAASRTTYWPASLETWASPFEPLLATVFGPILMIAVGCLVSLSFPRPINDANVDEENESSRG